MVCYNVGFLPPVEFDWIMGGVALNPLALPSSGDNLDLTFPYSAECQGQRTWGAGIAQRLLTMPGENALSRVQWSSGSICGCPCRDGLVFFAFQVSAAGVPLRAGSAQCILPGMPFLRQCGSHVRHSYHCSDVVRTLYRVLRLPLSPLAEPPGRRHSENESVDSE